VNFSFHVGGQRIAGIQNISVEEMTLKLIVKHFFVPDRDGGAWLIFDRTTGQGHALVVGPLKPHPRAERKLRKAKLPIGVALVSITFAPILAEFGPEALRWNGTAVEVRGQ